MKDNTQSTPQVENARSTLEPADLLTLSTQLNNRIDTLWHRVVYAHAIMVGVLVFFADPGLDFPFTVPRLLVMFFYTMNTAVTFVAFHEAYQGMRAVIADAQALGPTDSKVLGWLQTREFGWHVKRRAAILVILWCVIAYLILFPVFSDTDLIYGDFDPMIPDTTLSNF